jgi:adhesin/invasin
MNVRGTIPKMPARWPGPFGKSSSLAIVLALIVFSRPANAVTVNPGDQLIIAFRTLPSPSCYDAIANQPAPCDTLWFNIVFTDNRNGAHITAASLFDSSMFLGTFQTNNDCLRSGTCSGLIPSFVAPGSLYGGGSPVIDFRSILNGSIDGILYVSFSAPIDVDLNTANDFIGVGHAGQEGSTIGGYFLPVTSLNISTAASTQQFRSARTVGPPIEKSVFGIYNDFEGAMAIADYNGDGRPDFVSITTDPQTSASVMALMLQNNNGTFRLLEVPYLPLAVPVTADLNGDGHADLVSFVGGDPANNGFPGDPGWVTVSFGNGDGTFNLLPNMGLIGDSRLPTGVVADLNNDQRLDIVAASTDDAGNTFIQTWLNRGGGSFTPGPSYDRTVLNGGILAVGDFNQDGRQDLVISDAGKTKILLGNGDGSFRPGTIYSANPLYVAVADLNHDHHLDLVVATAKDTRILLGKGDGTFSVSATIASSFGAGVSQLQFVNPIRPSAVYVSDFNRDGFPDVAIATTSSSQSVTIYYGKGNGTFPNLKTFNIGGDTGSGILSAAFADLNRDGQIDVIGVDQFTGFNVAYGTTYGEFDAPIISQAPDAGGIEGEAFNGDGLAIVKEDFNGDGLDDIAVVDKPFCVSCDGVLVRVFLGTGKGYFLPANTYRVPIPWGNLAVGDVDGDGKPDLVVARSGEAYNMGAGLVYAGPDVSVLVGRGDGTFEAARNSTILGAPANTTFCGSIYLVDVNNDNKLDLVGDWGVALGKGNGSFAAPIRLPSTIKGIMAVVPGDFDGSGKMGLAVATNTIDGDSLRTPAYVNILSGNGTGSFTVRSRKSVGVLSTLAAADLNGDGLPDLLYTTFEGNTNLTRLYVDLNRGGATFSSATHDLPAVLFPFGILTGDFNQDGDVDVVVLGEGYNGGNVTLLPGTGQGTLANTPQFYHAYMGSGVVLNINGDSAPDIAGTNSVGVIRLLNTGHKAR